MKALPWIIAGVTLGAAITYVLTYEPTPQTATGYDGVEDAANQAWKWGTKSRVSGTGTNLAGKVKEGVGRFTNDPDLQDEGVADQAIGQVKDAAGTIAHAVGETIHDLNR